MNVTGEMSSRGNGNNLEDRNSSKRKGKSVNASSREIEILGRNQSKKGMVLPFVPLCITFDDMRYSVDMPQVSPNYNMFIKEKKIIPFQFEIFFFL